MIGHVWLLSHPICTDSKCQKVLYSRSSTNGSLDALLASGALMQQQQPDFQETLYACVFVHLCLLLHEKVLGGLVVSKFGI